MKSVVLIGIKNDQITIKINEEATQEQILETIKKKMTVIKKLCKEGKRTINVIGKVLKEKEKEEVIQLINSEVKEEILFENENELGLHGIKKVYEQNVENSEAYFFKGGIRSGQKLEFDGSIVVLGDVNSGAEVIAGDNIVVLGILRGLAHAGAKGNMKAIIASQKIECPQLRIANVVKEIEKEEIESEETKKFASIIDEKIVLE